MRCEIFQINNNLLKVRKTMTLLQKSPCISLSLQERRVSLSQRFFETSRFYHMFTILNSNEVCWLPTKSTKNNFYSRNLTFLLHDTKIAISQADISWSIHILPHFKWFSQWGTCVMFKNKYRPVYKLAKY